MTSPGNLSRASWTRKSPKPGDHVRVEFNPLRSRKHGGGFRSATLLDTGQQLTALLVDLEKRNWLRIATARERRICGEFGGNSTCHRNPRDPTEII
jgi:hypothetical protein